MKKVIFFHFYDNFFANNGIMISYMLRTVILECGLKK